MTQLIFLKPIFHEKIWGGNRLKSMYHYDIPSEQTGECWAISAHKNGDCLIENSKYDGMTLSQLYSTHRELFGNINGDVFPLLTKILDASDDLSVQVHPDDEYGLRVEGELGKTECWYVLNAQEGAEMIFGHHAMTRDEFESMIKEGRWNDLLRRIPVKKGDFFHVPTGTVHALLKGTLVLEIQQSSDTTYRLYDYDRRDDNGALRPLHIQHSIDVTTIPHKESTLNREVKMYGESVITTFVSCDFFTVSKYDVKDDLTIINEKPFLMMSVTDGAGSVNGISVKKGDHFIIPTQVKQVNIKGTLELVVGSL
ncbi:MAG: mannose-6-phosphate isomerase, class I [Turicibacter sp.]